MAPAATEESVASAEATEAASATPVAPAMPVAPAASSAPMTIFPKSQSSPISFTGWAQVDVVPWAGDSVDQLDPATGEPLNQERLLVRRARLRAQADRGELSGSLEFDGNTVAGPALRLLAAELRFTPRLGRRLGELELAVVAGLFKIPFGIEVPLPDRERFFLEPSRAARALFPGSYDAGVKILGRWKLLRWAVAATNGAPVGEAQFRGRDPSSSFDLVGRVGAEGGGCGITLSAGLSAVIGRGFHAGAPATKDEVVWVDANENGLVETTELQVIDGDPATPSEEFDHRALGVDVGGRWWARGLGWGRASAELVVATNLDRGLLIGDPIAQSRDLRELGWHVEVEQQLTSWARLGVRYDRYQPDRDAYEVTGLELVGVDPTWATWSVVAAVEDGERRLAIGYDHERNPLGRGEDGTPTTRSADRVTVRGQVGF
jgi:hypothetical protein